MHKPKSYQRLSFEQRVKLVVEINSRRSSAIKCAEVLRVSRQAIYDEIKNSRFTRQLQFAYEIPPCIHSRTCNDQRRKGTKCTKLECPSYEATTCKLLTKFPFVCNKCPKQATCNLDKFYYDPNLSHDTALALRIETRLKDYEHDAEVRHVNELISPIIKNRNSLHHAYVVHAQALSVCERTIRRWIYRRALDAKAHELPMWGRFARKPRNPRPKVDNFDVIAHRMYKDFQAFQAKNPALEALETDSVIGKLTDTKALMTIHVPSCNFMFGYVIKKGNSASFVQVYYKLRDLLGPADFAKLFPIIICDNGSETQQLYQLETLPDGTESGTKIFYCDPYSAWQRPTSERNHAYVRRVLPKSTSLNQLTDAFVQNMFSHINSIPRDSLQNKTPYYLFKAKYGDLILSKLGITPLAPQDVNLFEARFFR